MKKIKDLFMRHKVLGIISILALIIFIVLIYMVIWMTISNSSSYGSRLDGIEEVQIEDSEFKKKAKTLKAMDEVADATVRLQGKIIYYDITFVNGTSEDKAKEIANATLDTYDDEEKSFYDFEYVLTEETKDNVNEEDTTFTFFGSKQYSKTEITYTKG